MNNITLTLEQLSALTWIQTIKLGKETIIAVLDELSLDYDETDNYFRVCSKLYQYLKELRIEQLEATDNENTANVEDVTVVDVESLSFRELQLYSLGKLHRSHEEPATAPIASAPEPSKYRVLRTHYNKTGYYYGMRVKRLLVKDLATNEQFWVGSNALEDIQVGDIVTDSTGYGFVVPLNRNPVAAN